MFKPYPKPIKKEKKLKDCTVIGGRVIQNFKKSSSSKKKDPQRYRTSSGDLLTDSQITTRRNKVYANTLQPRESECECCGTYPARDHDHTISQRRCKILKVVELIWELCNWSLSCEKCHHEWESYKSGLFQHHRNVVQRMLFMKQHDKEGFNKRLNYITDQSILKQLSK